MPLRTSLLAAAALLPLASCSLATSCQPAAACEPRVLLEDDFEGENDNRYELNYIDFAHWKVTEGTVDLVGTPPFDDFLPLSQGMYVDLDGTSKNAGTMQSRERFSLAPGRYRLSFSMAGSPRPNQPPNTMSVFVGNLFSETITLRSYTPLQRFDRTFTVRSATSAYLVFRHEGGDDYGIFIDDVRFERL